jgi:hypothetical protein
MSDVQKGTRLPRAPARRRPELVRLVKSLPPGAAAILPLRGSPDERRQIVKWANGTAFRLWGSGAYRLRQSADAVEVSRHGR